MKRALAVTLLTFATALSASAAPTRLEPGRPASERPNILTDIGYEQKLGARVPLDLVFQDESGRERPLRELFHGRPVVLSLVYYECPMLCTLSLNGLVSALTILTLNPGRDFDLVTVSFDPRETAAQARARKNAYLARYHRAGAEEGWHFLTGKPDAVKRLTESVGFRYAWDEETHQFAHGTGIVVLTPDGVVSRYLYGIEYAPKDLRLALVESAAGKLGTPADRFLLACYQYDPKHGRYGAAIMRFVRLFAVLTIAGFVGFIGYALRRDRAARGRG